MFGTQQTRLIMFSESSNPAFYVKHSSRFDIWFHANIIIYIKISNECDTPVWLLSWADKCVTGTSDKLNEFFLKTRLFPIFIMIIY